MTTPSQNEVLLEGIPLDAPVPSHENHGTQFYRFFLQVPRLSGTPDTLPVLLPEALTAQVVPDAPLRRGWGSPATRSSCPAPCASPPSCAARPWAGASAT